MTGTTLTGGAVPHQQTGADDGETGSRTIEEVARRHPSLVTLGRIGWVGKGVVYTLLGVLAFQVVMHRLDQGSGDPGGVGTGGTAGDEASQTGAIARIAESSFGAVALYALVAGLLLYVLWRLVSVLLPAENTASAWLTRAGYLMSAVVYVALAWSALSFARHTGTTSQTEDSRVERFTRDLMERPGGRWLVGAIGVVVVGIGIYFAVKGIRAKFRDELEPRGVGPISHESIVTLGRVGWVGRGIVMGLVGWLLLRAAVRFRPEEAQGFDGALRDATGSSLGAVLVGFAAIALVTYGIFCVVSAPRQRLTGAD